MLTTLYDYRYRVLLSRFSGTLTPDDLTALRQAGIAEDPALVESAPDWGLESGHAATDHFLRRGTPFTAIFAHSDLMALALQSA